MDQDRGVLGKLRSTTAAWLAWSIFAVVLGLALADAVLLLANRSARGPHPYGFPGGEDLSALVSACVGALIASRHPRNSIGWLFCGIGLDFELATLSQQYAIHTLLVAPSSLPYGTLAAWLGSWVYIPGVILMITFLPLLFPDGHLVSPGWRLPAWAMGFVDLVFTALSALVQAPPRRIDLMNFSQFNLTGDVASVAFAVAGTAGMSFALLSAIALVLRLRRAVGEERQQLKWFAYAGALLALASQAAFALIFAGGHPSWFEVVFLLATMAIPLSAGIAVLKYRLYDIDIVINKTLLFGVMAAFITLVYVAIVVGIGHLVGTGGQPNLGLSILATALVAIAFQPVRERVQHAANRLVYGKRATPYEVLSKFSDRIASAYSGEEILPRLAQTVAESTGAEQAAIWAIQGPESTMLAGWPHPNGSSIPSAGPAERRTADLLVPVTHHGEVLGALSIRKARGDAVTPVDEKMLADLASPAGVVLRNLQLTRQLQARLAEIATQTTELQASSARIIAAQDSTRRRLERNIHDGAQQHLVAIAVKLRLAATLAKRDQVRAARLLDELEVETHQALETLHALARGIYPPILRELGLESAIRAQSARFALPVDISATRVTRYPSEIEGAVYFCSLEALQNVAKHAKATKVRIHLEDLGSELAFSVDDDGIGFDPSRVQRGSGLQNIADRLAALGGHLVVSPGPGGGTSLHGRVPVRNLEPVA